MKKILYLVILLFTLSSCSVEENKEVIKFDGDYSLIQYENISKIKNSAVKLTSTINLKQMDNGIYEFRYYKEYLNEITDSSSKMVKAQENTITGTKEDITNSFGGKISTIELEVEDITNLVETETKLEGDISIANMKDIFNVSTITVAHIVIDYNVDKTLKSVKITYETVDLNVTISINYQ